MVLIANIRSDVIQILVRLYFISYVTVTATFRITKMTTRSLATMSLAIFVKASLSRCMTVATLVNTTAVIPVYF